MLKPNRFLSMVVAGLALAALASPAALAQDLVILDCDAGTYLGVAGAFDCAPATGGTSAYSVIAAPSTLNPVTAQDTASGSVADHIFGGISFTTYNLFAGDAAGVVPQAAAVIEVNESATTVTYTLRSFQYSDGSTANVDDVMYWYNDVVYNPNLPNSATSVFACTDGSPYVYEAVSANQFSITCPETYRTFVGNAGGGFVMSKQMALDLISAQGIATESGVNGPRATAEFLGLGAPINLLRATGPYVMTQLDSQSVARFERNPNFYEVDSNGTRLPYLDNLEVLIIPTQGQNLSLSQFLGGQTDVLGPRPADIAPILGQAAGGGFTVNGDIDNGQAATGTTFVGVNYDDTDAGLANVARRPNVRRALSLAVDRVAAVNNVTLGIGAPQYIQINLANSGNAGATFFIGRDNTCADFASFNAPCSPNAAGVDTLTARTGLEIAVQNLPPPGLSAEADLHLSCLVDYEGCITAANNLLNAEGLVDTDGDGVRNLPGGGNWNIQVVTNAGNTIREGYTQVICAGWNRIGINCTANSIAFATLVAQLLGQAQWSGAILLGLTGGDPAGNVNTVKCGQPLYFWHISCDPEATSGPTAQTPDNAEMEAGFDAGFTATTVADAQTGFDQYQTAWLKYEPMIMVAIQNALFAVRTDRLCNDARAVNAFDDVKYRLDVAGNTGSCSSNAGR